METVTVSPKYQVVIPSRVRELLGVKPGQKVKVILYDNRIEMIPVKPIREAYGAILWTQDAHLDGAQGVQYKKSN